MMRGRGRFAACYNFMFDAAPESRPWCRASLHVRGPLAQLAEQQTLNLRVLGSIPRRLTTFPEHFDALFAGVVVLPRLWLRGGCVRLLRQVVYPSGHVDKDAPQP